ncbi:MAG: 4Fe-4S dicluster domain-containing protein [Rhodospirillales bacterium]|nr:4Fe-4S dicluster domain-containing protein [Rhodospirillales bacterium]
MSAPEPVARRSFLATALAGLTATVLGPGIVLMAFPGEAAAAPRPASTARRWGLLIDLSRCEDGCSRCVEACSGEHGWRTDSEGASEPQWVRIVHASDEDSGRTSQFPLMCQHCAQPPCADVCPTGATFRRADGVVLVDRHRCIGCRYCVMACPFGVRFFQGDTVRDQRPHSPRGKGTAEACNLCVHRVDHGGLPACVEACSTANSAMIFGDLNDPGSPIRAALSAIPTTRLRANLALGQGVRYHGL